MGDSSHIVSDKGRESVPDLNGERYFSVLQRLHEVLRPKSYLEVGVQAGQTLALSKCPSIGVDPQFVFNDITIVREIVTKPSISLFQMSSDDFFASHSPVKIFGRHVDFAFLDGMHRCEFLLRDFINTEQNSARNSLICLHDCLPLESPMAERTPGVEPFTPNRAGLWTGDVWRTARLLKRRRPDLSFTVIDSAPTGLVLITRLNPNDTSLLENYQDCVSEMLSWKLEDIGIARFFLEMGCQPSDIVSTSERITAKFWM